MNLVEKHSRILGQAECPLEVCGQKCKVRARQRGCEFSRDVQLRSAGAEKLGCRG